MARLRYFEEATMTARTASGAGPSTSVKLPRAKGDEGRAASPRAAIGAGPSTPVGLSRATGDEGPRVNPAARPTIQPHPVAKKHATTASAPSTETFWSPSRYMPKAISDATRELKLNTIVDIRDGGYQWQRARAFLDTGNQLMTIVDRAWAERHKVYVAGSTLFSEGTITIRGVVPGASAVAPVVTVALKIREQEYHVRVAVSELTGIDVLIGVDVLEQLFAAGFRLGPGPLLQ